MTVGERAPGQRPPSRRFGLKLLAAILSTYVSLSLVDRYVSSILVPSDFEPSWPVRFRPEVGFIFPPNAVVRCTDGFEFAVEQRANSLGFLDREHSIEKPPGTVRILVLGDSFVEACQVPREERFTALLERDLERTVPGRRFEVITMGSSGVGTVGETIFYDAYGRRFDPDLVIVVFVNNDFANDSPVLEAIRNGWHPRHPSRPFIERMEGSGEYRLLPADREFFRHVLADPSTQRPPTIVDSLRPHLGWSGLFRWIAKSVDARTKRVAYQTFMATNVGLVRALGESYERMLDGWHYPNDSDVDYIFYSDDLPPAFREAMETTEFALRMLSARLAAEGRGLLVVSVDGLSFEPPPAPNGRALRVDGYLAKLRAITEPNGIPLLDLHPEFQCRGNPRRAHWTHDGHWNQLGHQWAAEAIVEHLTANANLIRPRAVPAASSGS